MREPRTSPYLNENLESLLHVYAGMKEKVLEVFGEKGYEDFYNVFKRLVQNAKDQFATLEHGKRMEVEQAACIRNHAKASISYIIKNGKDDEGRWLSTPHYRFSIRIEGEVYGWVSMLQGFHGNPVQAQQKPIFTEN